MRADGAGHDALERLLQPRALPSGVVLRLFNEGSLLLVVPIVLLAVVKPL